MSGFFKIQRDYLETEEWLNGQPFDEAKAWIDLIGRSNYAKKEKLYRGTFQNVERGQLLTSERELAARWTWSKGKVHRYLKGLQKADRVTIESTEYGTTLTLKNYDFYQQARTTNRTKNGPQIDPQNGPQNGPVQAVEKSTKTDDGRTTERTTKRTTNRIEKRPQTGYTIRNKERKEEKNIYHEQTDDSRHDYGGVFLTDAEWDELEALCEDGSTFLQIIDRVGEWLEDNHKPPSRHKALVKTFMRNDGLI